MNTEISKRYGHPVIKDMPAPRLFQTNGGLTVRIALPYEKSAIGTADIYVHKACVKWVGDDYVDAKFDVLLVDKSYKLYYPVEDKDTGLMHLIEEEGEHPVEEICQMCEQAKSDYSKNPLKLPKRHFWQKEVYSPPAEWAEIHPEGMLNADYLSKDGTVPSF